ncbi:hypothetical protein GCM10010433_51840 [Streptomyces pulveraceus]
MSNLLWGKLGKGNLMCNLRRRVPEGRCGDVTGFRAGGVGVGESRGAGGRDQVFDMDGLG